MSLTLSNDLDVPAVVRTYLAAKLDRELDTILDCFTDDALVHDEEHDHLGRATLSVCVWPVPRANVPGGPLRSLALSPGHTENVQDGNP